MPPAPESAADPVQPTPHVFGTDACAPRVTAARVQRVGGSVPAALVRGVTRASPAR
jgi:hypothetical protein